MNRIIKSPKKTTRRSSGGKKQHRKNSSPKKQIKKSKRHSYGKKQIKKSRRRSRHQRIFDSFGANLGEGVGAINDPVLVAQNPEEPEPQPVEVVVGAAAFDRWVYQRLYENDYISVEPEKNIWRKTFFFPETYYTVNDSFRRYLINHNEYEIIDNNNFRHIGAGNIVGTGHIVDIRDKYNIREFLNNVADII